MIREEKWILNEKYNGEETDAFKADCERLNNGEPLAYIIGSIPFLNTKIHLDSKPLIPRPETEFWVEKAINRIKQTQNENRGLAPISELRVLDLCAGSGAIGVAVAKAIPQAHVTFGEIDSTHLDTIKKNLKQNTIIYDSKKYAVTQSNLFEHIEGIFDYILTNPPYIDKEANTVEQSVTSFEPHNALFGGHFGLELIEKIIMQAPTYLSKNGELWIEHEPFQVEEITKLAHTFGFSITVHNDQYAQARYSVLSMAQ